MAESRTVDPAALVERLGTDGWEEARDRLDALLADDARRERTLDAVLSGFEHEDADVRKWCVALMDHHATDRCVEPLLGALEDPRAPVRRHAVHSVGCQACKDEPLDVDVVGRLTERLETDTSVRVRRAAAHMLGTHPPDERVVDVLDGVLERACDEKLRRNARWARDQHADAVGRDAE